MVSCVAMTTLLLSSCGESGEKNIDYLAVRVSEDEGWSIIDKNGKVVVEDEYPKTSYISAVYDGVYWVETNGTFQLFSVDSPKKPVIDEEFTEVTEFQAGRAAVFVQGEPIRLIDTSGKTVATLGKNIKGCTKFSEDGVAAFVTSSGKFGVIDKDGKIVIKAEYDAAMPFGDGVVAALKNEKDKNVVMLDSKGKKLCTIKQKYLCLGGFSEGKILIVNSESSASRQEIWNKEGKRLFIINNSSSIGDDEAKYIDGYIIFRNDDKYGIVDSEGKTVIRAKYKHIINLGKGEFAVSKDGDKWGIVNTKDEEILGFYYSYALDATLGGNYLMKDGSEFLLIKRGGDNEVLGSFYAMSLSLYECQYVEDIAKDDAETDVYTDDTEDYPYVVDSICDYDALVDYEEW